MFKSIMRSLKFSLKVNNKVNLLKKGLNLDLLYSFYVRKYEKSSYKKMNYSLYFNQLSVLIKNIHKKAN